MHLKKLKLSSLYCASKEKGFFHITINSYDIIIGVIFLQNKYLYQILDIFTYIELSLVVSVLLIK